MKSDTELWFSFFQTFGMLFLVLAFFMAAFYLFRRMTGGGGIKGAGNPISVIAVHHLAPKEKLVLVSVGNNVFLLGVTPSGINRLATLDLDLSGFPAKTPGGFHDVLGRMMNRGKDKRSGAGTVYPSHNAPDRTGLNE